MPNPYSRIYAYNHLYVQSPKYMCSEEEEKNLSSKIFENAVLADPVLEAELLPELHADLVPTLSDLKRDDLPWHFPLIRKLTRVLYRKGKGKTTKRSRNSRPLPFSCSGAERFLKKERNEREI